MKILHYSLSIILILTSLTLASGQIHRKEYTGQKTLVQPIAKGVALLQASDCRSCHNDINKLVGPSYTEVAKKYEFTQANINKLSEIIIKGKKSFFGKISMPAHPAILNGDAGKMARYILSLNGEKEH